MASLNERIGDVVKRKRQRDRLTQADLGARIGVSGSYISGVEAAQTSPRITELEALGLRVEQVDSYIRNARTFKTHSTSNEWWAWWAATLGKRRP